MAAHKIARFGIGYVPEGREILTRLTVEDNLAIGGYVLTTKRMLLERREFIYGKFPILRSRRSQLAHSLSGGEQQMLAIARALMFSPQILLMDEPSLGLAPLIVAQVFELVSSLRNEGFSILLIEQNARKALQISQRGYILESGSFVVSDESKNLINNDEVKKAYLGG
jgi:branched-chain amino acid transport system ATP-binding protein